MTFPDWEVSERPVRKRHRPEETRALRALHKASALPFNQLHMGHLVLILLFFFTTVERAREKEGEKRKRKRKKKKKVREKVAACVCASGI